RFADGPDTPRTVARRREPVGRDANRLPVDAQLTLERADAREPRRLEQDAIAVTADVLRFGDRPVFGAVDDIEADAVVVGVAYQSQFMERLDHFDAVRTDL